jgi:hypothetical protein
MRIVFAGAFENAGIRLKATRKILGEIAEIAQREIAQKEIAQKEIAQKRK